MATTTNQQLPYPASSAAANVPADIQALAQASEKKMVQVFSSITDRTTRMPSPTEGMVCWLQDKNRFDYHTGVNWVAWPRLDTFPVNIPILAPGTTINSPVNSTQDTITLPAGYQGLNIRVAVHAFGTYYQQVGVGAAQTVGLAARVNSTNGTIQDSSTSVSGVTQRNMSAEISTAIDAATSFTVGVAGSHGVSNGGTWERLVLHVHVEAPRRVSPDVYTGHDGAA